MANNVRGGTLLDVRINGRPYDPTNDSSPTIDTVGFTYENEPTASGAVHSIKKRKFKGITDLEISLMPGDYEALSEIWNSGMEVEVSITLANGEAYGGLMMPEGELARSGEGKVTINFVGRDFMKIN